MTLRMSAPEARQATEHLSRDEGRKEIQAAKAKKSKRRKYGNEPTVVDGRRFDSKREAAYYCELKIREKLGEVSGLSLQPSFDLVNDDGKKIRYVADFAFWDHVADRFRVVDVKGVETRVFLLKKRMMKVLKRIEVEVVK